MIGSSSVAGGQGVALSAKRASRPSRVSGDLVTFAPAPPHAPSET